MQLHELRPPAGAKKNKRRVGRGHSAGQGKSAGRGVKGQHAREGVLKAPYFEGGQLPLVRRLPKKRGFTNIFKVTYVPVNVERLHRFAPGATVSPAEMAEAGLIKSSDLAVKVLGQGDLGVALTVKAHAFSASARQKIEAAGGRAEVLAL